MKTVFLLLGLMFASVYNGQNNVGCNYNQSNKFDFWVGNWNVYDTLGNKLGENRIEKQYENCVVQENWISSTLNKGTSYNYFNPIDSSWNQLWLDNQGSILKLKGSFKNKKMVLKSELIPGQKVAFYYNQISWSKNADGSVNQVWQILDEHDNLMQLAFFGVYKRK